MIQNTDVFERYLGFAGVGFRNRQEALVAEYVPDPESAEKLFEYATA
jgi:hypothetical protein